MFRWWMSLLLLRARSTTVRDDKVNSRLEHPNYPTDRYVLVLTPATYSRREKETVEVK